MDFSQDHFALFELPRCFALDKSELERRYHDIQARVHPDRHVHLGESERRLAMQWATRVNEAYQTLRQPLSRAQYLLHLAGVDVAKERGMPAEFLMQQMEWREAVAEMGQAGAADELEQLHHRLKQEMAEQYQLLQSLLDAAATEDSYSAAADTVRQLMFQEKLLAEIDDALEATEA